MPSKRYVNGKSARNTFVPVPCIIGVDLSYSRTGISVCTKGKVRLLKSVNFTKVKTRTNKRYLVRDVLKKIIQSCLKKYSPEEIVIITERIRTFTSADSLRPSVIKAHAAMLAYIVDTGIEFGIKTYTVDTRSWKSKVLGTSVPLIEPLEGVKNPQKIASVKKAIELGFKQEISVYTGNGARFTGYNDDMADALCISLYPFCNPPYHLTLET